MVEFLGEYEVTLDAKGRFLLPAGFKKQLPEGETHFVLNRGVEKCLTLYPRKVWEPIGRKISRLNDFNVKVREFTRRFVNGATPMELDSAGRLLIPPVLKEYAGLEKEIVLVAVLKKIEIWDKAVYKKLVDSYDADDEEFSKLAGAVMGGDDLDDLADEDTGK